MLLSGQMDNQIVVSDYAQMDRVLREERAYILNLIKQIKKAGCTVLLIQKSILRYEITTEHHRTVTNLKMLNYITIVMYNISSKVLTVFVIALSEML